jgi:membrane protein
MSKIISFFRKIYTFLRFGIWQITEQELSRSKWWLVGFGRIIILAVKGYIKDGLSSRASALTYSLLFALVPVMALLTGIARGFGVEGMIENFLRESFAAQAELIPVIMGFVTRYLATAQGGVFIGTGIAILLYSVINFFTQVENIFNGIWHVKRSRSIIGSFTMYFSAMLIIPLLIVVSSGLSIYVNAILTEMPLFSPLYKFAIKFSPWFVNWVIFTVLYLVVPNTKVKFINALLAGIIAGSAFQLFQMIYISGQVYLSRYNVVYGSFAAIPLLLLWLRFSCLIVLLGAEISYSAQNIRTFEYDYKARHISRRYSRFLTVFILHRIIKRFENQEEALSAGQIVSENLLPVNLTHRILDKLVECRIVIEVFNENDRSKTYQPAADINCMTLEWLFDKLENFGDSDFLDGKNKNLDSFHIKYKNIISLHENQYGKILVKDI